MAGFGADLIGGLIQGKPTIPAWQPVDLGKSQSQAIASNTASLPALETLGSQINNFNQQQLTALLQQTIPGYTALTTDASKNIDAMLKGDIPTDVAAAVQDSAAARSLTGGFGGSGLSGNLTARDLGLTSLDLINRGISTAQNWLSTMASIATSKQFDVTSMFITPQQQFQDTLENQTMQFQRDYVSNLNDWQHSFGYLAGKDIEGTVSTIESLASSFLGGALGGGGGSFQAGGGGATGD